jgi:hypothetical protein
MKFNIDKLMDLKNPSDLDNYKLNKPIFYKNYLFHYLIMFDKLELLKLNKHPINKVNEENLDGLMLAAKYNNIPILKYLIKEYPEYAIKHNSEGLNFINYIKNPSKIIKLMKEFPYIDWEYLFKFKNEQNITFYMVLIRQLNVKNLEWFISKYKFNSYFTLVAIIANKILTDSEKINIFNKFTDKEINTKNFENEGLIIKLINMEDTVLTEYFVKRNIDLEYVTNPYRLFLSPFFYLYSKITLKGYDDFKKIEKILELIWEKIKLDYNYVNKSGINYVQLVLQFNCKHCNSKILDKIIDEILINSPNESWLQLNLNKETPLFYLVKYPFNKYFKYIKNKKLNVKQKNNSGQTVLDIAPEKWAEELKKLDNFKVEDNVLLDLNKYQHYTIFTATNIDLILYFIYLSTKYKNLYIPKLYKNELNNIDKDIEYPWIILYQKEVSFEKGKFKLYSNLNLNINNIRRDKKYDYAVLFLSQFLENNLKHANIILYDFKNLSIERFEPYGDDGIENEIDNFLEETLTWNTGMKYFKPSKYLPKPGYQLLANENDYKNEKRGDFGGFCLGWCIWYVEHRIKNNNIDIITLNKKTLEKMLKLNDSLAEFIRNYSNTLFNKKLQIIKKICKDYICVKNMSNLYLSEELSDKIYNYANNFFSIK